MVKWIRFRQVGFCLSPATHYTINEYIKRSFNIGDENIFFQYRAYWQTHEIKLWSRVEFSVVAKFTSFPKLAPSRTIKILHQEIWANMEESDYLFMVQTHTKQSIPAHVYIICFIHIKLMSTSKSGKRRRTWLLWFWLISCKVRNLTRISSTQIPNPKT